MQRYRPNEITVAMPLLSGSLALLGGWLVAAGLRDAAAAPGGSAFHPGVAVLALPFGFLSFGALAVAAWAWRGDRWGTALLSSLIGLMTVIGVMITTSVAYRIAVTCTSRTCTGPPFPLASQRVVGALVLLILALVGTCLIVMNALDGFVGHPRGRARRPRIEPRA